MMTFIQNLRKQKGLTQEALAEKLDTHRTTVAKWETGRSRPRAEMLLRLAEVLDCTVDELLRTDDPDRMKNAERRKATCARKKTTTTTSPGSKSGSRTPS